MCVDVCICAHNYVEFLWSHAVEAERHTQASPCNVFPNCEKKATRGGLRMRLVQPYMIHNFQVAR